MIGMVPDYTTLNREHNDRLARSQRLRDVAKAVRQLRARSALRRAIEESLRSGCHRKEVEGEFALSLERVTSR
jgi:hypothetical protein